MKLTLRATGLLFGMLLGASAVSAQSDLAELSRIAADRLDAAQASLLAADGARDRVDALTRTVNAYEAGLDALREGLRNSALREGEIRASFDAHSEDLSRLLAVLMSIEGSQGPLTLLHPSGALGTARSGMIVSEVTPAIEKRTNELREMLQELAIIRSLQEAAVADLQRGLSGAQDARAALSQAISNREDLPPRFDVDEAAMSELANNAATLGDFATGLAELAIGDLSDDAIRSFAAAMGTLNLPVHGSVLRRFGEADAAGIKRPGLILAVAPQAMVTTPWPATVRYAGPLLDYGKVIILEPESGTLLILAGLDLLYAETGDFMQAGAPVGLMGGTPPDIGRASEASVEEAGFAQEETLYIELRLDTTPVDPAPWFAETKEGTQ